MAIQWLIPCRQPTTGLPPRCPNARLPAGRVCKHSYGFFGLSGAPRPENSRNSNRSRNGTRRCKQNFAKPDQHGVPGRVGMRCGKGKKGNGGLGALGPHCPRSFSCPWLGVLLPRRCKRRHKPAHSKIANIIGLNERPRPIRSVTCALTRGCRAGYIDVKNGRLFGSRNHSLT